MSLNEVGNFELEDLNLKENICAIPRVTVVRRSGSALSSAES